MRRHVSDPRPLGQPPSDHRSCFVERKPFCIDPCLVEIFLSRPFLQCWQPPPGLVRPIDTADRIRDRLAVYRDAGLDDPYGIRKEVLASPAFKALENRMLKRTMTYLIREGIFKDAELVAA